VGISRRRLMDFMRRQELVQRTAPVRKTAVVRPLVVSAPSKHWQADLLDVQSVEGSNARNRYILVVIDIFSKYTSTRGPSSPRRTMLWSRP
jgi:hypothetical protein